jgi:hypothetical protein
MPQPQQLLTRSSCYLHDIHLSLHSSRTVLELLSLDTNFWTRSFRLISTNQLCPPWAAAFSSNLSYDRRSFGRSIVVSGHHLEPATNYSFFPREVSSDIRILKKGHTLWREDGFVVYSCWPSSPAHLSRVWVPRESWQYFTIAILILPPPPGRPGSYIYFPQD